MSTFRGLNGEQITHRSSRPVEASTKVNRKSTPGGLAVAWSSLLVVLFA